MQELSFLIADDTESYRRLVHRLVSQCAGWQVVAEAEDGAAALRLAQNHRPAVILMDVAMPLLNGIDATRTLKDIAPDMRVVLFSGHHYPALLQAGLQAGADAFFWKEELDHRTLGQLINQWFPPPPIHEEVP